MPIRLKDINIMRKAVIASVIADTQAACAAAGYDAGSRIGKLFCILHAGRPA